MPPDVRVLSRSRQEHRAGIDYVTSDLTTGEGLDGAVAGAEIIMHLAGSARGDEEKARTLVRAVAQAGAKHLVYISVVGADRIPMASVIDRAMFGYFGAKHAAEQIVAGSGLPWTTLRATQFHDLLFTTAEQTAKLPVMPAPAGFKFQPIDPDEVAARLVELALDPPAGLVPAMGGPRVCEFAELLRGYLQATDRRRPVIPLWLPGKAAAAFRVGANLAPERAVGRRTWEDLLAEHAGSAHAGSAVPA